MSAHPFAPGAIERHSSAQRRALAVWLRRCLAVMTFCAATGLLGGLLWGALQ